MRLLLAVFLSLLSPVLATAQDKPNTILVLDASGSMWGQIDGVAKITIAQQVITDLLNTLPEDQNLGLTVYGARARGDCSDIQTVVAPGPGTRDAIAAAVAGIRPLGKTPMTDAVIAAAEALRYTEDSATVILVSDGVETCNPDPCAAAKLLEEAGINFTAHVIGFDVGSDPDALAQMQCIAAETGGQFLTAANASELTAALESVVAEPAPVPVPVTFRATRGEGGPDATGDMLWSVTAADGTVISLDEVGVPKVYDLVAGAYIATATGVGEEISGSADFVVIDRPIEVVVVLPAPIPDATLDAPDSAPQGATIQVGWTGPNGDLDYIEVSRPDDKTYVNYTYTRDGNPLGLEMPALPGSYEIRYRRDLDDMVLATREITVTEVPFALDAADSAPAGASLPVAWTGPGYDLDYIAVAAIGEQTYINYAYTKDGNPAMVEMPVEPGTYELRYILNQDNTVAATRPVTVTELTTGIVAPDAASAGETIQVGWNGPDYDLDYIGIGSTGDDSYINYTYTKDGNPLGLEMPVAPGDYEIRYYLNQDNEIIARHPITVSALKVELTAPPTAPAGATVPVGWSGPDYDRDYIGVGRPGDNAYINYTYTKDGNPTQLELPIEPGDYEIRYYLNQDNVIAQRVAVTVTPLKVQIVAPPSVSLADGTVTVGFDGPDYDRDYIAISKVGSDGYETYEYTRSGNPLQVRLPDTAGDYEIRYVLDQGATVAARLPLTVTDAP
jgi:Ca-activated chloride channel family protein